jgi:hypothetical protein
MMLSFKNIFSGKDEENNFPLANAILLFFTIITVFIVPLFHPKYQNLLYSLSLSFVFIFAVMAIKNNRKSILRMFIFIIVTIWVSFFSELEFLRQIFKAFNFLFFIFLVYSLIKQVSSTETVNAKVLVDAITGYLLLGFAYSLIVAIVAATVPEAYNANFYGTDPINALNPMYNNLYYTFMTFTSTGYGDITPTNPIAKSLAILISV